VEWVEARVLDGTVIEKVISGGQIGADIAALRAARKLDVPTGGYMPLGWLTIKGPRPEYEPWYGMVEASVPGYPFRTMMNVRESDGTLRFATSWDSRGELATLREIRKYRKPHYDIHPSYITTMDEQLSAVRQWISDHDIKILNVSGNATIGIEPFVEEFIERLLSK